MDTLRPVRWREGMFLRPHHFQQLELNLDALQVARVRALEPHAWGLVRLELDPEALTNFTIAVKALRAVFPSGALVDVPSNARVPSREVAAQLRGGGQTVDVHLGIRGREDRVPQARPDGPEASLGRFTIVEHETLDLEEAGEPVPVERLCYSARLFVGDESSHGYETLPLVRLAATGSPAEPVRVDPSFGPPALQLAGSPALLATTSAVAQRLALVLREMRQKGLGADPRNPLLFISLNSALPVLRDLAEEGDVHPRVAYRELARLAGSLLFRDEGGRSEDDIPPYVHEHPAPVFDRLRQIILDLSEPVIVKRWHRLPMSRAGDVFQTALPVEFRQPGVRLFLEVVVSTSQAQVRDLMARAKVSGPTRIPFLTQHFVPGIANEAMPGPPPELPPPQVAPFFRLKLEEGDEWIRYAVGSEELAVSILAAPPDLQLNLVVILPP